ncbi:hypoxanthine phosphoribosyltransferase [Caminicella sporogenes DSM 14501]|uniref:Hypoxanthine phosphoribosyltransferase n=1 Tax=Caminicella sporogenes DSM 14501 TaxID=1121266 RepID=A0A1M6KZ73_9FIRM|nr:hypoxanthine phosphoribosyltransferase [Caminicella sporogenes]RKD27652.1 hypoxanthine phosphoribosyltransferase [Caminicella sporogenes]SHJ64219.1 hypoxanthine phosphoribosyltransferase [Caminicella sporogenes DSM 14501]
MLNDVKEILFNEEEIKEKVAELGKQISKDYENKDLVVVGVLKGANVFLSDLIRKISIPITIDFMAVSSYGFSTESSGVVKILKDLDFSIEGKNVLIVEDIVDTGLTLKYLYENLKSRKPKSIKICSLLDKHERRKVDIEVDYIGFEIPDAFIVGYGIDYAEKYRNLPFIASLKEEVYSK